MLMSNFVAKFYKDCSSNYKQYGLESQFNNQIPRQYE